jgi:hypothetical protein
MPLSLARGVAKLALQLAKPIDKTSFVTSLNDLIPAYLNDMEVVLVCHCNSAEFSRHLPHQNP